MEKYLNNIEKANKKIYMLAKEHLDNLAKPIGSLGELEEISARLCSIYSSLKINIEKKCIIVLASDNGIFEEGVASTPQEVTAIQSINISKNKTGVGVLAKHFNINLMVCDLGINADINYDGIINKKIRKSTRNFLKEDAMTKDELIKAINIGIELVEKAIKQGNKLFGLGEMGIANTTTSSAVLACLLNLNEDDIENVVGLGAGLSEEAYKKKVQVIKDGIKNRNIDKSNVLDIVQKVGGYDIAGMIGVYIACSYYKMPIVVDGFISIVASLCAIKLNKNIKDYIFLSHQSMEKGYKLACDELNLPSYLNLKMRLGEGSGCPLMFSIIDASISIFNEMATFEEANISKDYLKNIPKI